MLHEVTIGDTQQLLEVQASDFMRVTKTRSEINKLFIRHFKMIVGLITIRTPVVFLFLFPLGFVSPGVTGRQHVYSLAEHL